VVQFTNLRLTGFKSFVDPTDLVIERGMTGVVGPNGCGKSNLVEALRWVMGENSPKRMRGGEMDDVIFSGTANRPARNLAEVAVVLDNSRRTAPAMFNDREDLEVTRRIERGSGSVFRVNGKEVRARDVQLLFADSATGAHSTAMVSQGRIGALINAKPTDRRSLLEEAAGITGLHSRRHEAELRLRAAETNLERLDDVIATLEAQLQGLKKQARQATRYRNIAEQIRRHEAIHLHLESEAARAALAAAETQLQAAEAEVARLTQIAAERAREQAEAAGTLPELRQDEAAAAAALQRLLVDRDNLEREEARIAAAQQAAQERLSQLEGDQARAAAAARDAEAAQARLEAERADLEAATAQEAEALGDAEAALAAASETVDAREAERGALAERIAADEARAAALQRRIAELSARLQRRRAEAEAVARQSAALEDERIPDAEIAAAAAAVESAESGLETARTQGESAEAALAEARAAEAAAGEAWRDAEARRAKLEAEAAALAALLEPAGDSGKPLVDSVIVAAGFETALGSALGDDLEVSDDRETPIHWRALPPYDSAPELPGEAAPLSTRVQGSPALLRRLSQIGVVADEETGARLQPRLRPGQRLVTRDGALWRWDGYTIRAGAKTSASTRLEQRNRLAEVRRALAGAEQAAQQARDAYTACQARTETALAEERAAREALRGAFAAVSAARQRHGEIGQKAAAVLSRLDTLGETARRLADEIAEDDSAIAANRREAEAMPDLTVAREELAELRDRLNRERGEQAGCRSVLDRLQREAAERRTRLAAIEEEKASWAQRRGDAENHMAEIATRLDTTRREIEDLAAQPAKLATARERLAVQVEAAEQRRRDAADDLARGERRLAETDRALKTAEHDLAAAREGRVRAEGGVAQAAQAHDTVDARIRERLECAPDALLEIAGVDPGQDLPTAEEVEAKLARLTRERENIGPVNLRAEAEAREVDQQINGMQSERADLVAAIARLRQGIASLNREGRERLLAAFEQVDKHFSELFVRLFGGGRAHLKLTEAEDPLDAGLEILASPPGKRLQIMSLLSGGEQALTALSLLFAVFLTNPAPICVLDEVDAPLDDANVDRFCTLLAELCHSGTTRFLVITHHRMTMARMDRLYGVTMGERGVSRLVSVDLGTAEELRESA